MELLDSEDGSGNQVSPVLPGHVNNYLIHIDGTVGEDMTVVRWSVDEGTGIS